MKLTYRFFWVNGLSYRKGMGVWQWAFNEPCLSLEDAKTAIELRRTQEDVVSVWITAQIDRTKEVVYHKCYVDAVGNIQVPTTRKVTHTYDLGKDG